ncbi:hypothetical protein [Spiroplasma sp. Moj]|uniref:hypothetical protein n=1 Tax=Spiroplasma sp. Moj TaxID=1922342 RepID=UPI0039EEA9DE
MKKKICLKKRYFTIWKTKWNYCRRTSKLQVNYSSEDIKELFNGDDLILWD